MNILKLYFKVFINFKYNKEILNNFLNKFKIYYILL